MTKRSIIPFSLLTISLLLFGCTAPDEVVSRDLGDGTEGPIVNEAEPMGKEETPAAEAPLKACDLLTVHDIASTCQNGKDPTLASEQSEDSTGLGNDCDFTIRIPAYGTEPEYPQHLGSLSLYYNEFNTKPYNVEELRYGFESTKKSSEMSDLHSNVIEVNSLGDYAFSYKIDDGRTVFEAAKGDHYKIRLTTAWGYRTLAGGYTDFPAICTYDEQKALAQLIVSRIR